MKSTLLIFRIFLFTTILSFPSFLKAQQKNTLDVKKHKDTILDKSSLKTIIKKGGNGSKHFLYTPETGGIQQSPGSLLSKGKSLRVSTPSRVVWSKETGQPIFITTNRSSNNKMIRAANPDDKKGACFAYLRELSPVTKILKPEKEFKVRKIETEPNGKSHIRLIQQYNGIEIYQAESIVHLTSSGYGEAFNGTFHSIPPSSEISIVPAVSASHAISNVIEDVSKKTRYRELSAQEKYWLDYQAPEVDTVLYQDKTLVNTYLLAYHISIHPNFTEHWEYLVDAKNGRIIEGYKNSCHVDGPRTASATDLNGVTYTINTYQEGADYVLADYSRTMFDPADSSGLILTMDANFTYGDNFNVQPITNTTNTWNDPIAVSAHHNAGVAFEYYKNAHGRNSIDGNGGTIYSFINVTDPETGQAFDNAFWNNRFMYYGNGDVYFKPLAGSQDVAGHEMTHGVVQNSANLKYQGESGAINESMADIFGVMMDSTDWLLGEDVVELAYYPTGCLRSISDPHNGGSSLSDPGYQPRHVSEQYTGTADNGGVHINSGIPNWAFYKYATALGSMNKASQVYYRALTIYLTQNSNFVDLRLAVIKAAEDLYGTGSTEATEAGLAFDAVGIVEGSGGGGGTTSTFEVNPGTEYMLSYDTDINVPSQGLLRSSSSGTNFALLLNKSVANKPSVTDNGQTCVYVGTDNKIHRINVDPSQSTNNTILENTPVWSNVAISKDGKRIAAVTLDQDTSIYVYDLTTSQGVRYILYNPTFLEGVKSGGPMYADALEWDYTGEYLIYDCFNQITSASNEDIQFWDINLIRVWDNTANDFSDGEIFKLFNNLEEGEGLGNPVFAKNSPNVIAFDYVNEITAEFGVFGLDIEQNALDIIAVNNYLGWPSYNKFDNRVAFTGDDGFGNLNIYYVPLNADKISSSSTETGLIANAMWPVYYAVGTRVTGIEEEKDVEMSDLKLFPNPARDELSVMLPAAGSEAFTLEIANQLGQLVYTKTYTSFTGEQLELAVGELPSGVYSLRYRTNTRSVAKKFVRQDSANR